MPCFDTDFLIAYLQNDPAATKKLKDLEARREPVAATTIVNAAELWKGVYRSKKDREKEAAKVKWLLDSLELLLLDYESARIVGELDASMRSNAIGEPDLLIASIVLANGETLITKNIRHFGRVPGLKVASW